MMLADSCEAAARSLARPDPENIRAIVVKIVDAIISDGQLDECDITLQELTTIREAMISALTAIYHARIDYPGFQSTADWSNADAARGRSRQRRAWRHLQQAVRHSHQPRRRSGRRSHPAQSR